MAETINITVCGDGGCGKSSITLRLVRSQWTHEYDPTIEDSYSVTRTVDGLPYFLSLTDTAGQEEYRGLWAAANLKSDAFLLVYDITNAASLTTLDFFLDMIDVETEQRAENNARLRRELGGDGSGEFGEEIAVGSPPPVKIVAGNKCDLKDSRAVAAREGLEYARKRGCGFMETSAREMVNIEETFALIVRRVVEARRQHHRQQFPGQNRPDGQPHSSLLKTSPSQLFPSTSSMQPVSHSPTAPLTAEERRSNHSAADQKQDDASVGNSQWRGIGRALSRRVTRLKKSKSAMLRVADNSNNHDNAEVTETARGDVNAHARGPQRSKSVHHDDRPSSRLDVKTDDSREAARTPSWWKRMLC